MSMMIPSAFDPGYSVSMIVIGGTPQPRWAFSRVPLEIELPELPRRAVPPTRPIELSPALSPEDDVERWDGLS